MIARDEAAFLDRCLTTTRSLVDEIIVVDTGSTDNTVALFLPNQRLFDSGVSWCWQDDW